MLVIDCPDHGCRVMVSNTRIRRIRNTEAGILLTVECWCGARVQVNTGARTHTPLRPAA